MVGPLDPSDDRDAQLLASGPDLAVQDVLLQEAEEALHGGVVSGRADPAHRSDHGMPGESAHVLPASKLRSPVGMQHAAGDVTTPGDRVVQRVDRDAGLHPRVDRIAHDPVGEHVLDRAKVKLAFQRAMLRDVRQPQLVRHRRGEVPLDEVVMDRWAGLRALAPLGLLAERREPAVGRADPPRGPLSHHLPGVAGLVG